MKDSAMVDRGRSTAAVRGELPLSETEVRILPAAPVFEAVAREIPRNVAAPFIKVNHYSGTVPTGFNIFFGCYVDGALFAVADYGTIASRTEPAIITRRTDATRANTLELRRLCRIGTENDKGHVRLSDFLLVCHRALRSKGYRYILSYSDHAHNKFAVKRPGEQHSSGGIYRFARFKHIGETPTEWHCKDRKGRTVHRSRAYRRMLAHNIALCAKLGKPVTRKPTGNKAREWPAALLFATDSTLPADKLWTLPQVRKAMGLKKFESPPKDKWLLDLNQKRFFTLTTNLS